MIPACRPDEAVFCMRKAISRPGTIPIRHQAIGIRHQAPLVSLYVIQPIPPSVWLYIGRMRRGFRKTYNCFENERICLYCAVFERA